MEKNEITQRVMDTLRTRPDLLQQVAEFIIEDGLVDEATFEWAEQICVAAFGPRAPCEVCGAPILPGFRCFECSES